MRPLTILLAVAFCAAVAAPVSAPKATPVVGIVGEGFPYHRLARFHETTLRPLTRRVPTGGHAWGWSFSPDGGTLVLGGENESCVGGTTSLRFVDLTRMKVLGDVSVTTHGHVDSTAWLGGSRVLAVAATGDCLSQTKTVVAAVDADARRLVRAATLAGDVLQVARAPGGLVLLLAPHGRVGTTRLAVVDADGHVRVARLGEIRGGRTPMDPNDSSMTVVRPGLAVDPAGRAFVVPVGDRLAEVELATLRVEYRKVSERRSRLQRLKRWLDPPAAAKSTDGPTRQALWAGGGFLAVTGVDSVDTTSGGVTSTAAVAFGLRLVDTRTWTYRRLDGDVTSVRRVGGMLLATGSSYRFEGEERIDSGAGLIAYRPWGAERYRRFANTAVELATYGHRSYVTVTEPGEKAKSFAFDPYSGTAGRRVRAEALWPLLGDPGPA